MKQTLELRDDMGNRGLLEFEIPADSRTVQNRRSIIIAMEFSRMAGILETLGNLPEGYFQRHKLDFLDWAEEFVQSGQEDMVLFFEKKLELQKDVSETC